MRPTFGFKDQLSLNPGLKYCRMLQLEHSAILSTFIKLPFVIKIFVLSILSSRFTLQVLVYSLVDIGFTYREMGLKLFICPLLPLEEHSSVK